MHVNMLSTWVCVIFVWFVLWIFECVSDINMFLCFSGRKGEIDLPLLSDSDMDSEVEFTIFFVQEDKLGKQLSFEKFWNLDSPLACSSLYDAWKDQT